MIVNKTVIRKGFGSIQSKTSQKIAKEEIERFRKMEKEDGIELEIYTSEVAGKISYLKIVWSK